MDFRNIDVSRIQWINSKVCYGAGKLIFQTPPMSFTCTHTSTGKIDILLASVPFGFRTFIQKLEATYTKAPDKLLYETVAWNGTMRLSIYPDADCLWFDVHGLVLDAPYEHARAGTCACIVLITGVWTTPTSWGLKFVLKEVKEVVTEKKEDVWHFKEDVQEVEDKNVWLFR